MEKEWEIIEEMIELTGENEAYYLSQATARNIKIRGKMIRSSDGKLYPVLVKAMYRPVQSKTAPDQENLCWKPVKQSPNHSSKPTSQKWYHPLVNWAKRMIRA